MSNPPEPTNHDEADTIREYAADLENRLDRINNLLGTASYILAYTPSQLQGLRAVLGEAAKLTEY